MSTPLSPPSTPGASRPHPTDPITTTTHALLLNQVNPFLRFHHPSDNSLSPKYLDTLSAAYIITPCQLPTAEARRLLYRLEGLLTEIEAELTPSARNAVFEEGLERMSELMVWLGLLKVREPEEGRRKSFEEEGWEDWTLL